MPQKHHTPPNTTGTGQTLTEEGPRTRRDHQPCPQENSGNHAPPFTRPHTGIHQNRSLPHTFQNNDHCHNPQTNKARWKGGTWSKLNRTKVYSISKKLSSAKVSNPLYLNSSHVVRAKPLHSSLHQKRSPSLKKNHFLCQFHFVFLNNLTINVLLFHPRVV